MSHPPVCPGSPLSPLVLAAALRLPEVGTSAEALVGPEDELVLTSKYASLVRLWAKFCETPSTRAASWIQLGSCSAKNECSTMSIDLVGKVSSSNTMKVTSTSRADWSARAMLTLNARVPRPQ